jgi:hypothetical protein
MSVSKKLLQAAAGAAGAEALDVDEVFSTFLYDGNSSTQTITNNIDLSGEGGLVWIKNRENTSGPHYLHDSEMSSDIHYLQSQSNTGLASGAAITKNNNGFSIASTSWEGLNASGEDYVSWTFRKAPKFFDVVTYTGTSSAKTVSHNLGSVPGMIIVKCTNDTGNWRVYHRGLDGGNAPEDYVINLNLTNAEGNSSSFWNDTAPTSTEFTVGGDDDVNDFGDTYVAYLFAHNNSDGEFGPDGDQDVIKCGGYTGNGSTDGTEVNLGFEPQWLMIKATSVARDWHLFDAMRGTVTGGNDSLLKANLTDAESSSAEFVSFTSTGFKLNSTDNKVNGGNHTYIYMAIRRGPLAAPESATDVFDVDINTQAINSSNAPPRTPFPVDMGIYKARDASGTAWPIFARLQGANYLQTQATDVEGSGYTTWDQMDGWGISTASWESSANYVFYNWKRAPSYFDVVAATGVGGNSSYKHGLNAIPEMMWYKKRSATSDWWVYHKDLGNTKYLKLNSTAASATGNIWQDTTPTSDTYYIGSGNNMSNSGQTFINYLFATLAGVSKVGSYTGNGSSQNIDCGFSSGARFVLIKNADATGSWAVFDTERGIVAGNDNYLKLDSTSAEGGGYDFIDPLSSGFTINQTGGVVLNESGQTYIFYAIA